METWFDSHSGASNGDDDAPVAAVDKRSNKLVIKHHGDKAELELH